MTDTVTKEWHWIGNTLMASEFGEAVELCNVDWSDLDEFEAEHKSLISAAPDLYDALQLALDIIGGFHRPYNLCGHELSAALAKARGGGTDSPGGR